MANFNRNLVNTKNYYELKKSEMLFTMQNDIENLEKSLKNADKTNMKRNFLKKIRKFLVLLRAIAPYIITAGITFGSFKAIGFTPFHRDLIKDDLDIKKTYDSFGNVCIEEQYREYKDTTDYLYHYSRWTEEKDGFYSRKVDVYKLNSASETVILKLLEEERFNADLTYLLGNPISSKTQYNSNLSYSDLEQGEYLEGIFFDSDQDDYIYVKQDFDEEVFNVIIFLVVLLLLEKIPMKYRDDYSNFDLFARIDEINDKYELIDKEKLQKKLEIKKNNYERLTK